MKKGIKGFLIGVVVTLFLTGNVVANGVYQSIEVLANFANFEVNGVYQSIEVLANFANFEVNGEKVDVDNFVYNGTTYIPIRKAAEMLGMEVGWNDDTHTVGLNDKKEKNISSSNLSNSTIKNYLDKVLLENDEIEILYGEFLDSDKFAYLSRINDDLLLNIIFKEKGEIKLVSQEISNSLQIGVVKLEGNSSKSFYTLDYADGYMFGTSYTFNNNKIIEKGFSKAHADINENDEVYRFTSPESFGGSSHSFYGLNNEYVVNDTLLDIMGVDRNEHIKIRIGWEFENYFKEENNLEVPFTDIFLVLNGETSEKIKIGSYIGHAVEIKEFKNRNLPIDTIIACQSWYAGGGDDLCVVYKSNNNLSIQWRPIYEPNGDDDDFKLLEFEEIKEIKLPQNAIVESINNISN